MKRKLYLVAGAACVLMIAAISGCGKKADDAAATAPATTTAPVVPASVPPEAKAQIQQNIERGRADGAAYAAQQKAHAAQGK